MKKQSKKLHELVSHQDEDGVWNYHCADCGQAVHRVVGGQALHWVTKSQAEHECPNDVAKAMLPHHAKKIKDLLDELGVSIGIHEDSYYSGSAELVLVDNETRVAYLLETEKLG